MFYGFSTSKDYNHHGQLFIIAKGPSTITRGSRSYLCTCTLTGNTTILAYNSLVVSALDLKISISLNDSHTSNM